jgi:hypothetical protein
MITKQLLDRLFPITGLDPRKYNLVRDRARLLDALNRILPKYSIDNYLRLSAFFGNCGIETDYFKTTIEYASGDAYEGRENLGNTQPGDGRRFKGRGLTQTTGRFNYEAVQKAIGAALFLVDAVDKNVSADQLKLAGRTAGSKVWRRLIRPLAMFYTALEAGNVAAWLGVVVLPSSSGCCSIGTGTISSVSSTNSNPNS